jgi:hypothetical protein
VVPWSPRMSSGLPQRRLRSQELTEEDTMIQHPIITAAVAEQRRAAFMAEAETARQARTARSTGDGNGSTARPARLFGARRHPRHAAARRGLARLRPARAR